MDPDRTAISGYQWFDCSGDKPIWACPACRGRLNREEMNVRCSDCRRVYPVQDEVPVLLTDVSLAVHDELDHLRENEQKRRQAEFFDEAPSKEFEISRPRGTPRLYSWFLREKFKRSSEPIPWLSGSTTLVVCGGSGMDAEFLALAGARVVSSDISLGAAQRAKARAVRFGVAFGSVVADAENLPLSDRSVDIAYVHDGLHHLDRPEVALSEMCRVSGRAVVISEPAQALITSLAVRYGYALEREESGNRVARLKPDRIAAIVSAKGFRIIRSERYAMYYKHRPGKVFEILSRPTVFPLVVLAWSWINVLLGRFGNKMVLVAVREDVPSQ
jgi:SAM-dependent methyltransferase